MNYLILPQYGLDPLFKDGHGFVQAALSVMLKGQLHYLFLGQKIQQSWAETSMEEKSANADANVMRMVRGKKKGIACINLIQTR